MDVLLHEDGVLSKYPTRPRVRGGIYRTNSRAVPRKQDGLKFSHDRILAACLRRPSIRFRNPIHVRRSSDGGKDVGSDTTCWSAPVGIVTWLLVLCFGSLAVKPGVDFEESIMMIIGPAIYAIGANLCFTLGWIVDTSLYRGRPRNRLWKAGLIFSLVLTALPGIWAVIAWCITLYTGKKLD